jgi:FkbM family methyltransferase
VGIRRRLTSVPGGIWNPHATEADVYHCYRLLLGRPPEPDGWRHFLDMLDEIELPGLVETFLCSEEFRNSPTYAALLGHDPESEPILIELAGRSMYVNPADPTTTSILDGFGWEPDVTAVVERVIQPGWTVIDIGANVGYFTLLAASRVGTSGRVVAFEPGRDNCGLLLLSVIKNGFDNVMVQPFALSDEVGVLIYERLVGSNALVRPVDAGESLRTGGRRQLVQGVRLDDLPLGLDRVDLIKIDVEGAELRAMSGAAELMKCFRPLLITEFSPPALRSVSGVEGEDYIEFLTGLGYRDVSVIQPDGSLIAHGVDGGAVVDTWRQSGRDHLDLLVTP